MRPEEGMMRGSQAYMATAGTDAEPEGWVAVGTLVSLDLTNEDLTDEGEIWWQETLQIAKLVNNFSVSTTFKFKLEGQLAYRQHLRMWFGIESPSLIHNGKKRRR